MNSSTRARDKQPAISFTQEFRPELIARVRSLEAMGNLDERAGRGGTFVKTARILAMRVETPFIVQTDRGPMRAAAGDWLVTNHPDDDTSSDLWSISDERMRATYELSTDDA